MIPPRTEPEFHRLADPLIDHIGWLGLHVEVYRDRADAERCEMIVVDMGTRENWTVRGNGIYHCACVLADAVGIELEDG